MSIRGLIIVLTLSLLAGPVLADDTGGGTVSVPSGGSSDSELDRRIAWLESTLDDGAGYSKFWQYGWTSGYSMGVVLGTTQAATADHQSKRVSGIVMASKAVIGTGRLLWSPHPGRLGAQPMRDIEGNDHAAKMAKVAAGEAQLNAIAERAEKRHRWERHAGNVGLNMIGGGIIAGFGHTKEALISTGVGIAVGELMIWTSPKRGEADLAAYQQSFAGSPQDPGWTVSLVPTYGGAAVKFDW
jgi:hypothetical protein